MVYHKISVGKKPKGTVGIESFRGRLRLHMPRSLYDGSNKYLTTEFLDTPEGWEAAQALAATIEADIRQDLIVPGTFDRSLVKYGRQPSQAQLTVIESISKPSIKLSELWQKFLEYKSTILKPKTLEEYHAVSKLLSKIESDEPIEVRERLLKLTTNHVAKRTLMLLSACYKWAIQRRLVNRNPFAGMYNELPEFKWRQETKPNPFSSQEKELVLQAFENHNKGRKGISYSYYLPFVKFLFMTGCRPSEAIGLQWKHISDNLTWISFEENVVRVKGQEVRNKGSKNNKKRRFPINAALQELLESIKPQECDPESLVFPSRDGFSIRYNDFSRRAWNKIVDPIKPDTTPYCCRDTFICEQVSKGVPTAVIGKWVDNSVGVIERHYLGSNTLEQLKPL